MGLEELDASGTITVATRSGADFEFPVGDTLINVVNKQFPPLRYSQSEGIKRFLEKNDVSMKTVMDTILDGEELGRVKVERFLTNTGARPLFAPIVEEGIRNGLNRVQAQWEDLIATTIPVDQLAIEYYEFNNGTPPVGAGATGIEEFRLRRIGQGAYIPTARVTISQKSVQLWKRGRGIEWTDEAKMAPIDLASMWFAQVGLQLGWDYHENIIDVLLNGYFDDGTDDAPVLATATPGDIDFADLLTAQGTMQITYGYTPNVMIMSLARSVAIRTMENGAGQLVFPTGVEAANLPPIRLATSLPDDKVIFEDTGFALVRYVNKELGSEFDRVPQTQTEGSYATTLDLIIPQFKNARLILDA
jgi:hypothetical protein